MYRILVMGYDKRSRSLNKLLSANCKNPVDFCEPKEFDFDKIADRDYGIIVLPIPTKTEETNILSGYDIPLDKITGNWKEARYVYGTIVKNKAFDNVKGLSLLEDEDFVMKNAYLTAKAAMDIAFGCKKINLGSVMVVGNGRIGKYLCRMLTEKNADIVLATSGFDDEELSKRYKACIGYAEMPDYIDDCGIIFNTAPYNFFTYSQLDNYDGRYYELASKPYGFKYGNNLPKSVTMCSSLPGKYYPQEAAEIIYDSIYDFVVKGVIL